MVLFRILGPLEVLGHDGSARRPGAGKPATVLGALLLAPGTWVSVDRLVGLAWPGTAPPTSAEANLKTYVWQLRRLLPEHADGSRIESGSGGYRLRLDAGELDADQAARHFAHARLATAAGDHETALDLLQRALRLWRGQPLAGLDCLAGEAVERLGELRGQLRESLAETQLKLGRTADAVATLRVLTAEDPLREDAWARLVRALHTMGRPAQALAAYHQAYRLLATELDVRPGPELTEALRLVRGDRSPSAPSPRRELPRDVPWFTGRDEELRAVRRACGDIAPVIVVDGEAGTGKTAFAVHAAGLAPERFPDGQFFVDLHARDRLTPLEPFDVLGRLLRGLGLPTALVPSEVDERAALWRSELACRRLLLVLDDAASREQVEPLLPGTGSSAVLITTRDRHWHVDGATRLHLGPLPPAEAVELFRAAAGNRCGRDDAASVARIVRYCDGRPRALRDLAATLQASPQWTVQRLAAGLGCQEHGKIA
ncbi:AfsR/SARP family transcriptional regulator [Amycolatopsis sp. H20-H5]|uniref:AfsR/SARP family transcriptional regulator n=1 Tax=Amycolatopsis sp. H20-H5 TaxID=3046309 RepID=UPI002DB82FFC|nr:AfsR/SARP family transcriptional regulator [Amycolatopsis sp. H20-H5]MEC3978826.1 AfsR/SARP family transcriptional regulator [Amycolatopsis sp. H20-H5]